MICKNCGASNDDGVMFCTSCGAQLNSNPVDGSVDISAEPKKGFAIASLILGISSLVGNIVCCGSFGLPAILGIVFGAVAKNGGNKTSKAKVGLTLSIISIILAIIMSIIGFFAGFVGGFIEGMMGTAGY